MLPLALLRVALTLGCTGLTPHAPTPAEPTPVEPTPVEPQAALPAPAADVPATAAPATRPLATVTGQAMGGELSIHIRCGGKHNDCLKAGVVARESIIAREAQATDWRPDSPIGAINAHPGEWQPLSWELSGLLLTATRVAKASDGAFDPTIGAVWGLWDFDEGRIPDPAALAAAVAHIDRREIEIEPDRARVTTPGTAITLGGIAQGWAAHAALEDIPTDWDAAIDLSGDVAVRGLWPIEIQHPRAPRGTPIATVHVRDAVLVTSGDYEKVFEKNGQRYHHVLDPRTGSPATAARSATVVHTDGAVADALATALLVRGADAALVTSLGGWALVVDAEGAIHELGTRGTQVEGVDR
jgi:FAD:protein FMN transferase